VKKPFAWPRKSLCGHCGACGRNATARHDRMCRCRSSAAVLPDFSTHCISPEHGTDAIVLEAQEPGWGASGNNAASLNPGLTLVPTPQATFGTPTSAGRMIAFAYNTPVFTLDLIRRLGSHGEARQNGTLRAAYHEKNAAEVETTAEHASVAACRLRCLTAMARERRRERIDTSGPCWIGAAATCSRELCARSCPRRDRGRRGDSWPHAGYVVATRERTMGASRARAGGSRGKNS